MIRVLPLLLIPGLLPTVAAAQSPAFSLPAGCTAFVTVQKADCTLSHHFTCEGDPEGYQRRVELDETGLTFYGTINAETQWVQSYHARAGVTERLMDNATDPASFTALLADGVDTYDFRVMDDAGLMTHFIGEDRLTGETTVIDGVTLRNTEYRIRALDGAGTEIWRAAGNEYIHPDWRLFLSATSKVQNSTDSFESDDHPVEFAFPDEAGFLASKPKFGCNAVMSSYDPSSDAAPSLSPVSLQ
jgi:hypothetical protein